MEWAEEVGLGEMGLMPWEFWRLTVHEFRVKHEAFMRGENRARSLVLELALMSGNVKAEKQNEWRRSINTLRQYPVKRWLLRSE